MARKVYVWRDGKMVQVSSDYKAPRARPNFGIIQDTMDRTWHPGDGRFYDSKSAFRRATKALGLEEVGDSLPPPPPDAPMQHSDAGGIRQDIIEVAKKTRFIE